MIINFNINKFKIHSIFKNVCIEEFLKSGSRSEVFSKSKRIFIFFKYVLKTIWIVFAIFNINFNLAKSQDSLLNIKADKIYVDNIGNIFCVQKDVITKYFVNNQIKTFSIKTFGTLKNIDVSNSLRVLLYFNDFQRILFLDSQLSQNGDVIELINLGYEQTSLVCSSFNNGFWIYHQGNNELIRFNQNLEISVKTGNLKRILNMNIQPVYMIEHNGKLYLNSPENGILVFDIYGAYIKLIPLLNISEFQIQYPYIFYNQNGKFYSFHINTFESIEIPTDSENCKQIIFNGKYCYKHCENSIKILDCIK